jgi:hypothetical protein
MPIRTALINALIDIPEKKKKKQQQQHPLEFLSGQIQHFGDPRVNGASIILRFGAYLHIDFGPW